MKLKNFVSIDQLDKEDFWELMNTAESLKRDLRAGKDHRVLPGKTLGMVFLKPSLRTRVSFEVGMTQLGGHAVYLGPDDIKLGERETTEDIGLVLSRYVDGIMARVFGHEVMEDLANYSTVPVINGLTDHLHPCQALADFFTIYESKRKLGGLKLAFVGDGNNVAHSLINAAGLVEMDFAIACPEGLEPDESIVKEAKKSTKVEVCHEPKVAVEGADVIYTDVWASMGEEDVAEEKKNRFDGFRVDEELLDGAKPDARVMHCLPAHYDEEISQSVAHGDQSVIFEQAENRMHTQKALLALLLNE
ncbi:MAG: ornithine carbamoyltransferase [Candidatus Bipolaricaulota bacterium]